MAGGGGLGAVVVAVSGSGGGGWQGSCGRRRRRLTTRSRVHRETVRSALCPAPPHIRLFLVSVAPLPSARFPRRPSASGSFASPTNEPPRQPAMARLADQATGRTHERTEEEAARSTHSHIASQGRWPLLAFGSSFFPSFLLLFPSFLLSLSAPFFFSAAPFLLLCSHRRTCAAWRRWWRRSCSTVHRDYRWRDVHRAWPSPRREGRYVGDGGM